MENIIFVENIKAKVMGNYSDASHFIPKKLGSLYLLLKVAFHVQARKGSARMVVYGKGC